MLYLTDEEILYQRVFQRIAAEPKKAIAIMMTSFQRAADLATVQRRVLMKTTSCMVSRRVKFCLFVVRHLGWTSGWMTSCQIAMQKLWPTTSLR